MKRILLSTTALLTALPFITTSLSCYNTYMGQRYDTNDDGKLLISSNFKEYSYEATLLDEVVRDYNQNNSPSEYDVNVEYHGNDERVITDINWKLTKGYKDDMPNMLFANPEVMGSVTKKEMEMNFDKYFDSRKYYNETFLAENLNVEGHTTTTTTTLPVLRTCDFLYMNEPLTAYILKTFQDAKGKIADEGADKIQGLLSKYFSGTANADIAVIAGKWTPITPKPPVPSEFANGIDDTIFTSFSTFIKFITFARQLFVPNPDLVILNIYDIVDIIYSMSYSIAETDMKKFLYYLGDDGKIKYNLLNQSNNSMLKALYNEITDAIKYGAISIADRNSSVTPGDSLKIHNAAFIYDDASVFRSTLRHSKIGKYVVNGNIAENGTVLYRQLTENQNPVQKHIGTFEIETGATVKVWGYNYVGPHSKNDILISNDADDQKLAKWIADNTGKPLPIFVSEYSKASTLDEIYKSGNTTSLIPIGKNRNTQLKGDGRYLVLATGILKDGESLQYSDDETKNELQTIYTMNKHKTTERFNISRMKGSSLIGVHNNEKENSETAKFVEWFIGSKVMVLEDELVEPAYYMATLTGNVFPSKTTLGNTTASDTRVFSDPIVNSRSLVDTNYMRLLIHFRNMQLQQGAVGKIYGLVPPINDKTWTIAKMLEDGFTDIYKKGEWVSREDENGEIIRVWESPEFQTMIQQIKSVIL